MSTYRFGRTQKVLTLVPIAAASAVWTASLVGLGTTSASSADRSAGDTSTLLPDGTTVPTEAIEAPASVSKGLPGERRTMVKNASATGIPSPALAAYQRAETVINAADKTCRLPWQLVAAIGRVESDHGRYGGNVLDDEGVARPGIFGIPLNGKNSTRKITDTDAGQYDRDQVYDRAVGPMQFIPSTWQVVGVDADSDGKRNPQDIDDAALATAVYLCSGADDLSKEPGQRAAVFRYNHSQQYVDLVLSIMNAYLDGDYTSVPGGTTSAGWIERDPTYVAPGTRDPKEPQQGGGDAGDDGAGVDVGADPGGSTDDGSGGDSGGNDDGGGDDGPSVPTDGPDNPLPSNPLPSIPLPNPSTPVPSIPLPSTSITPVDDTLSYAQALAQCTVEGVIDNPLTAVNELDACIKRKRG